MNVYPRHADDTAELEPAEPTVEEMTVTGVPDDVNLAEDPFADDLSDQLDAVAPKQWVSRTTIALAALVLLVGGFVAGAQVQKHWGTSANSAQSGTGNPFANLAGGGAAGGGFAGRNGASAGATSGTGGTTGTVKLVDGNTIYITTADGQTVIVKTSGTTTVQTSQAGSLKDLTAGSSVTVQGQTGSDGSVTATRITKTK
jgi:hypothetical protein